MAMKAAQSEGREAKPQISDQMHNPVRGGSSGPKSNYIGLTLKEYLGLKEGKNSMEEIEEEPSESQHTNSPAFKNTHNGFLEDKHGDASDKSKQKSGHKQELLSIVNNILHQPQSKIPTVNLENFTSFQKQSQKLPAIHQQRSTNKSRNAVAKEESQELKRERCHTLKAEQLEMAGEVNFSLRKQAEKGRMAELSKYSMEMKKNVRTRIISTTFYHMQLKQKEKMRIKTEEPAVDKHLQNSFMITRYKESNFNKKQRAEQHQNIFKRH